MKSNNAKMVATIQVIPYNTTLDTSHKIIEESIQFLKTQSKIEYRLGAMNTVIGGAFSDVMEVINNLQLNVLLQHDNEYFMNISFHASKNQDLLISDKEQRFVGI